LLNGVKTHNIPCKITLFSDSTYPMQIQLNGKNLTVESGLTLKQLIELQGLADKRLAAEVNMEIITKAEHQNTILNEGDSIEIVHAIGGG